MEKIRINFERKHRVIKFELNPNYIQKIILSSLTYAASKLWNIANYERMNWTKESGKIYPDWYEQKKRLKTHFWYKSLSSQTAQELLKQLDGSWKSFYKLKKTGAVLNPSPPGYKHTNFNIRFLKKSFLVLDSKIRLTVSRQQKEYIKNRYNITIDFLYIKIPNDYKDFEGNIKIIEIIPIQKSNRYMVNIIIELPKKSIIENNGIYMSIDLGIINLMTCYISTGKSMIISGRQLLSIDRYYDREISYYQSIAHAQQRAIGDYPKNTKRTSMPYRKRRKQINHLLHAAAKTVVDKAVSEGVSKFIIGDVSNIRDGIDMGKVNNQKLHKWPFRRIIDMISYKAEDAGIEVNFQEESYTSQCSPYALEVTSAIADKSNRIHRGLYQFNNLRLSHSLCKPLG
ncbi:MAG: IS200/IS605 family element transposase accessory protein TnpB [Gracilibacteraceae bacterium]|nr:IS200/IS605 family element transposase accessory protein TnpB [Gracilibacteraceae bacterium]